MSTTPNTFQKHNFRSGQILTASALNDIENEVVRLGQSGGTGGVNVEYIPVVLEGNDYVLGSSATREELIRCITSINNGSIGFFRLVGVDGSVAVAPINETYCGQYYFARGICSSVITSVSSTGTILSADEIFLMINVMIDGENIDFKFNEFSKELNVPQDDNDALD